MATAKKKWVVFKGNVTIPADMAGEDDDTKVQAGAPTQVPAFYADSVVQDGIADHCDAPKKKAAAKQLAAKKSVEPTAEQQAAAEKATQIATAETAVTDAQAALDAVGLGKPAGPEIAALKAAKDALEALQD